MKLKKTVKMMRFLVDSIDMKEDRRPKNIKNLEVRIDFIGGDHDDNEDVGEESPENFRKAPRVKLEKKKVVKFICTHCKCVSYSSFAASTLECKVHNMVRHDIDESKSNPESRMDTVTTTLNVYGNMNDLNVRRKFNAINTKNPKEGTLFKEGDEKMCAFLFKKTLLSKEAKNVFTMEAIMKENPQEYENFLNAMERGVKQEIYEKWRQGGIFKVLTEACISLRVVRTEIMEDRASEKDKKEGKVFKSFFIGVYGSQIH